MSEEKKFLPPSCSNISFFENFSLRNSRIINFLKRRIVLRNSMIRAWKSKYLMGFWNFGASQFLRVFGSIQKAWRYEKWRKTATTHVTHIWRFFEFDIRNQRQKIYFPANFGWNPLNFSFPEILVENSCKNSWNFEFWRNSLKICGKVYFLTLIPNIKF